MSENLANGGIIENASAYFEDLFNRVASSDTTKTDAENLRMLCGMVSDWFGLLRLNYLPTPETPAETDCSIPVPDGYVTGTEMLESDHPVWVEGEGNIWVKDNKVEGQRRKAFAQRLASRKRTAALYITRLDNQECLADKVFRPVSDTDLCYLEPTKYCPVLENFPVLMDKDGDYWLNYKWSKTTEITPILVDYNNHQPEKLQRAIYLIDGTTERENVEALWGDYGPFRPVMDEEYKWGPSLKGRWDDYRELYKDITGKEME